MAGAALSALGGLFTGIWDRTYSYWRDQVADNRADRDFDYQKALQNQIFEREDNAVQRRMADLQAAGLNPNLAAGSAAGAGAVVGRSNTPTSNFHTGAGNPIGNALDMASHVAQLQNQREQNKIFKNEQRKSAAEADMAENANTLDRLELYNLLGLEPKIYMYKDKIKAGYDYNQNDVFNNPQSGLFLYTEMGKNGWHGTGKDMNAANSRLFNYFNWQFQNQKNSADLLQKDVNWYTADKIANYAGTASSIFSGLGSGYKSFNYHGYRR